MRAMKRPTKKNRDLRLHPLYYLDEWLNLNELRDGELGRQNLLNMAALIYYHSGFSHSPAAGAMERAQHDQTLERLVSNSKALLKLLESLPTEKAMEIADAFDNVVFDCSVLGIYGPALPYTVGQQRNLQTASARSVVRNKSDKVRRQAIIQSKYQGKLKHGKAGAAAVFRQLHGFFAESGIETPSAKTIERDIIDIIGPPSNARRRPPKEIDDGF
jgi:hypothetical protein